MHYKANNEQLRYMYMYEDMTDYHTYIHVHTYISLFSNNYFNKLDMPTGS